VRRVRGDWENGARGRQELEGQKIQRGVPQAEEKIQRGIM